MVYTWIADVSALLEEHTYEVYYQSIPGFRKEKADRIRFREDKALSVGAWTLWERMRETYGWKEGCVFNLSHSGRFALCSASEDREEKIGCDIERIGKARVGMAERFYCQAEAEDVKNQKTMQEQIDRFYRYWVLKESFLKATKKGMKLDTRSFEIQFDMENRPFLANQPEAFPEKYFFQEYHVDGVNAKIAVCSTSDSFSKIHVEEMK